MLEQFSEAKTMKNREKMVLKTMRFFDIDFLSMFFDFWSILEGFGEDLGTVLGGFFIDFLYYYRKWRFGENPCFTTVKPLFLRFRHETN